MPLRPMFVAQKLPVTLYFAWYADFFPVYLPTSCGVAIVTLLLANQFKEVVAMSYFHPVFAWSPVNYK